MSSSRACQLAAISAYVVLAGSPASAHHSVAGFFSADDSLEIEGVVTAARWRNPHTEFEVEVTGPNGDTTAWRVETGAISVLRSRGLDRAFIGVGDQVKVYGRESLRGLNEIFADNLLLSNGSEVLLTVGSAPHFTRAGDGELLAAVYDEAIGTAARRNAEGIFRVWSTNIEEIPFSGFRMFHGDYPMTDEAAAIRAEWDAGDASLLGCTPWNMPYIMYNPLPMEFVRDGDNIVLRLEEDDNERMIYMSPAESGASSPASLLGHSAGRWEGDTLVVETGSLIPGNLDEHGTPFSASLRLTEWFMPSDDGARLDYRMRIDDPVMFTEPFEVERYWIWRPEISIQPYACAEEQDLP